eukprot:c14854_g1_i1.p1 GENE.c14854_g1_i1~~c14854_g1_i1.p1  ORF type:complete len:463 (-),score=84.37 c14854_g1_i1:100-1488(-)
MLEDLCFEFEPRDKLKNNTRIVSRMALLATISAFFSHFPGSNFSGRESVVFDSSVPSDFVDVDEKLSTGTSTRELYASLDDIRAGKKFKHKEHSESFWTLSCCARRSKPELDEGACTDDDQWTSQLSQKSKSLVSIVLTQKISQVLAETISEAEDALYAGNHPHALEDGMGGVYRIVGLKGQPLAIFKPCGEEVGCIDNPKGYTPVEEFRAARAGIGAGEAAFREVAAYVLDKDFAGVPPTTLVDCTLFNSSKEIHETKRGSFQCFIESDCTSEDMGCALFPVLDVQKIAFLDIRLLNLDRHQGNILVSRNTDKTMCLTPIDHGCCLPEKLKVSSFEWCWLNWPQVKKPMLPEIITEIESLDPAQDIQFLNTAGLNLPAPSLINLRLTTVVLKAAVQAQRSLYDVAVFVSRDDDDSPSLLERIILRAKWQASAKKVLNHDLNTNELSIGIIARESLNHFLSL